MAIESAEADRRRARERNERLAARVGRWSRTRLALTILCAAIGCAIVVALRSVAIAFPLFALSVLFLVLYLDAHDQVREIRRRNWRTLNPFRPTAPPSSERTPHDPKMAGSSEPN
jgi:hypothetical protein